MGERLWVDHEDCRHFIDNIKASFNTRPSPFVPSDFSDTTGTSTTTETTLPSIDVEELSVSQRYAGNHLAIENLILDVAKEYLVRRQSTEGISRNLLKLLAAAAGILEVVFKFIKFD